MSPAKKLSRQPLCLGCNYPLMGLSSNRCPECGRIFDLDDERTFNKTGRPVGKAVRWLVTPVGWPTILLAGVALGVMGYLTDPRALRPEASDVEWRLYRPFLDVRNWRLWIGKYDQRDFLMVAGAVALAVGGLLYLVRTTLMAAARLLRRPAPPLVPRQWRRQLLAAAPLAIAAVLLSGGWAYRMAHARAIHPPRGGTNLAAAILSPQEEKVVLETAVLHLPRVEQRMTGLKLLVEQHERCGPFLCAAAKRERNPEVLATMVRLLGMHRDPAHAPVINPFLDHADARVRSAAADALGLIHRPAFTTAFGVVAEPVIDGPVPIEVGRLLSSGPRDWIYLKRTVVELPDAYRARLARKLAATEDPQERRAVAQALLEWQPPRYSLRVAECAVFTAAHLDEVNPDRAISSVPPAFVPREPSPAIRPSHGPGGPRLSVRSTIFITPSVPLAMDVQVLLRRGEPYSAYPPPDRIAFDQLETPQALRDQPPDPRLRGRQLALPRYLHHEPEPLRSAGYPWLLFPNLHMRGSAGATLEADSLLLAGFGSFGPRWQTVVASPDPLPGTKAADVPVAEPHRWWASLRGVKSGWLSVGAETEKFLHYDGPTLLTSPVRAALHANVLYLSPRDLPVPRNIRSNRAPFRYVETPGPRHRQAMLIQNRNGRITGSSVPMGVSDARLKLDELPIASREAMEREFVRMLEVAGLNESEAAAMDAAWHQHVFDQPGTRLIVLLSARDIDALCPLAIRPRPTELVRVGLLLTELGR